MEELIGYLYEGHFCCPDCMDKLVRRNFFDMRKRCPVYRINIGIYSQQCSECKKLIVDGVKKADHSGPLNLFSEGL